MEKNKKKERYCVSYQTQKGWSEVKATTESEAITLYNMIGEEASFKVLYDTVSGVQLMQA